MLATSAKWDARFVLIRRRPDLNQHSSLTAAPCPAQADVSSVLTTAFGVSGRGARDPSRSSRRACCKGANFKANMSRGAPRKGGGRARLTVGAPPSRVRFSKHTGHTRACRAGGTLTAFATIFGRTRNENVRTVRPRIARRNAPAGYSLPCVGHEFEPRWPPLAGRRCVHAASSVWSTMRTSISSVPPRILA